MGESLWEGRWENWDDDQLTRALYDGDEQLRRHQRYSQTILDHITPKVTLDIGGGSGTLGKFLPGDYIVMDHPRIEKFCEEGRFVPIGPLKEVTPQPDLVVNTNCWGETTLEIVTDYIRQIEELEIPYLYINNRRSRQVSFGEYPIWDNWEPLVLREIPGVAPFIEFLGRLR